MNSTHLMYETVMQVGILWINTNKSYLDKC